VDEIKRDETRFEKKERHVFIVIGKSLLLLLTLRLLSPGTGSKSKTEHMMFIKESTHKSHVRYQPPQNTIKIDQFDVFEETGMFEDDFEALYIELKNGLSQSWSGGLFNHKLC
jgi:hypothetical protein